MSKKAILVVSFGTSHLDTKAKTIDHITNKIKNEFSDCSVYEAFTSSMIKKILWKKHNIHVCNVTEAMEAMLEDGIEEVKVQPTHIINGFEYEKMLNQLEPYKEKFKTVTCGVPLLTDTEDYFEFTDKLMNEMPVLEENEAIVFMGHGTDHYINVTYSAMNDIFRRRGYKHAYVGTVEAFPDLDDILERLGEKDYKKVYLTPFMIVAGEHVKNDMLTDDESWLNKLKEAGYEVVPIIKGLGEYEFVASLFINHIKDSIKECV
ncbi:MAG: sirohydrochlorin cobaltochelatase [bacterium]|nr:sirohydrochlorin cobaltochelatase [bacterium]